MGKFEIYRATNNEFRFRLKASNGEIILKSEGYGSKQGCINGIQSVKTNAPIDGRYERRTSSSNHPYFVLKAANGEIIGVSEQYSSGAAMENGIQSVKTNAPSARADDLS